MARRLKTYITSEGFFDKAVAAPSMKAALEAWGSSHNLFHQGFAEESSDPAIIAAAMQHPGVIVKRPVGSDAPFTEEAELPVTLLADTEHATAAKKRNARLPKLAIRTDKNAAAQRDNIALKAFAQEKKQRENQRRKDEIRRRRMAEKREAAVAAATLALEHSEKEHARRSSALQTQLAAITKKIEAEENSWQTQRKRLEARVNNAKQK